MQPVGNQPQNQRPVGDGLLGQNFIFVIFTGRQAQCKAIVCKHFFCAQMGKTTLHIGKARSLKLCAWREVQLRLCLPVHSTDAQRRVGGRVQVM